MQKRWLTVADVAEYLSLNVKTVYAQAAKGEIPSAKIGFEQVKIRLFMNSSRESHVA